MKEKEELIATLKGNTKVPESFNWSSPKQLSALLFGGKVTLSERVPDGTWKSGKRQGMVKFKTVDTTYVFPRLLTPIKGTETKTQGVFSTDEEHLTKLGKHGMVADILRIRAIEKLIGTYLQKLPAMQDEHNWGKQYIHGQFSQTTTATGRLASSRPNLQNFPPEANRLIISRY
jgi:DNA polymerase I-like protein with 3'-5' exonuclease and polymerase domains